MLKQIKTFRYEGTHPTVEALQEAFIIACENDCIVRLQWINFHTQYEIYIDSSDTIQTMLKKLPDYPMMFCPDFEEGYQTFGSWDEFMELLSHHTKVSTRPLYVHPAQLTADNMLFVDVSQFIVVPWDELENYI